MTAAPTAPLTAFVDGIGVIGPGFDDWPCARAIFRGEAPYESRPANLPLPAGLPPSERRRASRAIKVALAAGHEAIAMAGRDPATLATVFTSSAGDGHNCHELCRQLATDDRRISPTRFHNSVHNAPAGYWGIATGAMATSTVLCAHDASFGAGLIEAMAQVVAERVPVVLIAYDSDYPEPLRSVRPVPDSLGIALVLMPASTGRSIARLRVAPTRAPASGIAGENDGIRADPALECLRASAPAARALPLVFALARSGESRVVLDYLDWMRLAVEVSPPD